MYLEYTNVLTKRGFIPLSHVKSNDEIAVFSMQTSEWLGFQNPSKIIRQTFNGELYNWQHISVHGDTPILDWHSNHFKVRSAAELDCGKARILRCAVFSSQEHDYASYKQGYIDGAVLSRGYALNSGKIRIHFPFFKIAQKFRNFVPNAHIVKHNKTSNVFIDIPNYTMRPIYNQPYMKGLREGMMLGGAYAIVSNENKDLLVEFSALGGYYVSDKKSYLKITREDSFLIGVNYKRQLRKKLFSGVLCNVICDDMAICYKSNNTVFLGK